MTHMTLRRAPTPPPTSPGWYYGQIRVADDKSSIEPVRTAFLHEAFMCYINGCWISPDRFIWYGPVPVCEKATMP